MENTEFPIFCYELKGDDTNYRCLLKSVTKDQFSSFDFCNHVSSEFQTIIDHLNHDHGYKFTKNIDYCCDSLFESRLDALHHYLSHMCDLEEVETALEPYNTIDLKLWLSDFFENINKQRTCIANKIMFGDDIAQILNEEDLPPLPPTQ